MALSHRAAATARNKQWPDHKRGGNMHENNKLLPDTEPAAESLPEDAAEEKSCAHARSVGEDTAKIMVDNEVRNLIQTAIASFTAKGGKLAADS
jgi:hypothetical protein